MSALVGRGREITRLHGLAAEVAAGRGQSVWIEGEPGVGKSALLAACLAEARRLGCQAFTGQADEADVLFPLRVLLDAMEVVPGTTEPSRVRLATLLWGGDNDIAESTPSDATATAVAAEALLVVIERCCAAGPVLLAVDDLQWADELSLATWARLHRAVAQLPLLLVGVARPVPQRDEVDRLRRTVSADAVVLGLTPLADSEVIRLVGELVGGAPGPQLLGKARMAGGNPLYLTELVDVLVREGWVRVHDGAAELVAVASARSDTPGSLAAVINARLKFLSEPTTGALRLAALLGVDFSVDHLGTLSGRSGTELVGVVSEAMAAGVVVDAGTSLMFRHPLIREALYLATPAALRAALHRDAARALAAGGAPAEDVAHQLLSAPPAADPWVVDWLLAAARILMYRAPQVALNLLQRVLGTAGADDPRRETLDTHLVTVLFLLGQFDQVEVLARTVLARGDPASAGPVAWTLAYALLRQARYEQAATVAEQALHTRGLSALWTARIEAIHALILVTSGRYEETLTVAAQAETDGQRVGDRLAVGYALHALSLAQDRHLRDPTAFLVTVDRALATISELPETTDLRLILLGNRASMLGELGRSTEAHHAIGQALTLAERAGTPPRLAMVRVQAADLGYYLGHWDDSTAELAAATDLPLDTAKRLWLRGLAALIAIHRGDQDAARHYLGNDEDLALLAGDLRYYGFNLLAARALAAERDSQPRQALELLVRAFDAESTLEFRLLYSAMSLWLPDVVRLALSIGADDIAQAATAASVAEAELHSQPPAPAVARHCRGLLESKPDDVRAAAGLHREIGCYPLATAQALEDAAVLYAAGGAVPEARAAYTEAVRIYAGLEATWDIRRADARIRPLGVRRGVRGSRRRPTSGWQSLTPTELKIASLVAAGQSNPDIATELYLSRRTVQGHVSRILTKLDARSRVDIARHALSAQTTPS